MGSVFLWGARPLGQKAGWCQNVGPTFQTSKLCWLCCPGARMGGGSWGWPLQKEVGNRAGGGTGGRGLGCCPRCRWVLGQSLAEAGASSSPASGFPAPPPAQLCTGLCTRRGALPSPAAP